MNKLKLIKIIVFFLTFMIFFGILISAGIIYKRITKTEIVSEISLNQPSGSYIDSYKVDNQNIYVMIKGGNVSDRIIVINQSSKNIISTIKTF